MKLWENNTPFYNEEYGQDPVIIPYLVDSKTPTGAVIVFPGGAYCMHADHEGEPVARMFNALGMSAFVLKYRLKPYKHPVMITDANRAVRLVRYHAKEWNIDPQKIGILGFSAGGHLATTAVEQFDYGKDDGDEIDKFSCRPDFGVLCYPVVTMYTKLTNGTTKNVLIGQDATDDFVKGLSGEHNVRDDTPPLFIWHTAEDQVVHVANSLNLALALKEKSIPYELHVFPYGWHGLGLVRGQNDPKISHVAQWTDLLANWLKLNEFC